MSRKLKLVVGIVTACAVIAAVFFFSRGKEDSFADKYSDTPNLDVDVGGIGRDNTYAKYLEAHSQAVYPDKEVEVAVTDYAKGEDVEVLKNYEGEPEVLYTG